MPKTRVRIFAYNYIVSILNYNHDLICAIEEEEEALATFAAEEEAAKQPAQGGEQQQQQKEQWKVVDAPDGKFEDFATAGVRTAELVAAGARAPSHVADAVLGLRRGGADDREPARGISEAGPGIGVNATTIGINFL